MWEAGKSCCGPKRFYALVVGTGGLLLLAVGTAIAVPLHLRVDATQVLVASTPVSLLGNVQVQGDSHSLVHIQEGIDTSIGHSGRPGVRGPIRHLGLVVGVGICCILFVVASAHQMWRFVTFRPRTAEVPLREPMEEAHHQRDMEAQYREYMGREMAMFVSQRQLAAGNCPDQLVLPGGLVAPAGAVPAVDPQSPALYAPFPGVLGSSGNGVDPQGARLTTRTVVPVCSPQVQAAGPVPVDAVLDVPVSVGVMASHNRSDEQCLQELRDSQRWAERQQAVLRVQAPVFVPGEALPLNFRV